MNKDQGAGIFERLVYSAVLFIAMKAVGKGYIDQDMAIYIAVGAMGLPSVIWAWWHNRPTAVLNRAAEVVPDNAHLVISTTPSASPSEREEAKALAATAGDKVIANTT